MVVLRSKRIIFCCWLFFYSWVGVIVILAWYHLVVVGAVGGGGSDIWRSDVCMKHTCKAFCCLYSGVPCFSRGVFLCGVFFFCFPRCPENSPPVVRRFFVCSHVLGGSVRDGEWLAAGIGRLVLWRGVLAGGATKARLSAASRMWGCDGGKITQGIMVKTRFILFLLIEPAQGAPGVLSVWRRRCAWDGEKRARVFVCVCGCAFDFLLEELSWKSTQQCSVSCSV